MKQSVFIETSIFLSGGQPLTQPQGLDPAEDYCIRAVGALLKIGRRVGREIPVFFGSAFGVLQNLHELTRVNASQGALKVNPSKFPDTVLNAPACRASIEHQLTGPVYNLSGGRLSAVQAIWLAAMQIADGVCEEAIVCGAEAASQIAQKIDPWLTQSSGGAVLLSRKQGTLQVKDCQPPVFINELGPLPAHGSVDLFRRLAEAINQKQSGRLEIIQTDRERRQTLVLHAG